MMKKFAFTIFTAILSLSPLAAQDCLTPAPPDFLRNEQVRFNVLPRNLAFTVKLFVHVINNDNGMGGPSRQQVLDELDRLEAYYNPHNICFALTGIDDINDSGYALPDSLPAALADQLVIDYPPLPDVVNIYILPDYTFFRGTAYNIPSTYMTIYAGRFNTPHMSHEMGHCLGLYHTHETASGAELVDGSNCGGAGDRLCDTPADPGLSSTVDASCVYTGTTTDANGDAYTPDVTNTMSYAPFNCRGAFTANQETRMQAILSSSFTTTNDILVKDMNLIVCCATVSAGTQIETSLDDLTSYDFIADNSAVVHFIAEDAIALQPGFRATPNAQGDFWAYLNGFCDGDFPDGVPVNSLAIRPGAVAATAPAEARSVTGSFSLYPNPAGEEVTLRIPDVGSSNVRVSIYALNGSRTWYSREWKQDIPRQFRIDLNGLPAGTYLCRIVADGAVNTLKFVKVE